MLLQVLLRYVLRGVRVRDGRCFRRQAADDSVLVRVDVGLRRWVVVLMHPSPFRSLAAVEDLRLEGGERRAGGGERDRSWGALWWLRLAGPRRAVCATIDPLIGIPRHDGRNAAPLGDRRYSSVSRGSSTWRSPARPATIAP